MAVDGESALHEWGNSLTSLVGSGRPLAKGFMRSRPRSPGRSCYATVAVDDTPDGLDAEGMTSAFGMTITVWSATDRESSRQAAVALVDELRALSRNTPTVGSTRLLMAAPVGWPEFVEDDSGEFRHTVETTIYAASA